MQAFDARVFLVYARAREHILANQTDSSSLSTAALMCLSRFYENWSQRKLALIEKRTLRLALLQNVLGKFFDNFFWQNNDHYRHFIAAVDSKPMSLPWMRRQPQADIAGDQPI